MRIDGVLPERSVMLIAGEPFTGKSLISLEMAIGMASGTTALDRSAKRCRVAYMGMDSPKWDLGRQLKKLLRGREMPPERLDGDLYMHWGAPERILNGPREMGAFLGLLEEMAIDAVVVDTLRKAHLHEENPSVGMTIVTDMARAIADEGISVVLLHHQGKAQEGRSKAYQARGSTVLPGSVDVHWVVERVNRDRVRIEVAKARAGEEIGFDLLIQRSPEQVRLFRTASPDRQTKEKSRRTKRGSP